MNESSRDSAAGIDDVEAVRQYLVLLRDHRPQRGRPRDPDKLQRKLAELDAAIELAKQDDPLAALTLLQERIDLRNELEELRRRASLPDLTESFIAALPRYSTEHNISYAAWRELGVPAVVLRRAGLRAS